MRERFEVDNVYRQTDDSEDYYFLVVKIDYDKDWPVRTINLTQSKNIKAGGENGWHVELYSSVSKIGNKKDFPEFFI